ncbi:MarR family winged helix-turn-helix transcriptional regulator [Propylenella binzhouense]|uniref:MarR family transcriptional regulator n=1 Tax=Propylenella binzhouense TaxID=2555902 RepID=A0A964WTZ3_9HYPH|nr:MarR family transcriptional regulator [Propylenella binzhouense]MYZ48320.1 MarR family transcriptional regulator [Propylenella binzhouense]
MAERKQRGTKRQQAAARSDQRVREAEDVLRRELALLWRIHALSYVMTRRPRRDPGLHARLSLVAWRVLLTLANCGGLAASEIVTLWGLEKMGVNRAVAELLKRGLIRRGTDPDGGRRIPLYATESGLELYGQAWPGAREDYDLLAGTLSADELAAFNSASDRLLARARDVTG